MKFQDWLKEWLENYIMPSSKLRTYRRYEEIIAQHIVPMLGEYEMSELTPIVLQKYVIELMKTGNLKTKKSLSANSVNAIITVVQSSLKTAFKFNFISEYTADRIKRPKVTEKRVECFSLIEQRKIEQYILEKKQQKLYGILICLYTGLRIGELLSLEWGDINFEKNEINVNKTCHYGKNEQEKYTRMIDLPKSNSSLRIIPIPKNLISILKDIKKKSRSIYVVSSDEKPMSIRSYQRTFSEILKKLNIPHRGFHSLRHTFATRAIECGVDIKTLSEILGHKSATVTLNRYAHSLTEHKKEMMNRVGKLL